MKTNYQTPKIEVVEIELEDLLCYSLGDGTDSDSDSLEGLLPGVDI